MNGLTAWLVQRLQQTTSGPAYQAKWPNLKGSAYLGGNSNRRSEAYGERGPTLPKMQLCRLARVVNSQPRRD